MSASTQRTAVLRDLQSKQTPEVLAYLAGLFDGEGCVSTTSHRYKDREYPTYTLIFAQNDRMLCDLFVQTLGVGNVYARPPRRPGHKIHHTWRANNYDAVIAARKLAPYLRLKRSKAQELVTAVEAKGLARQRPEGRSSSEMSRNDQDKERILAAFVDFDPDKPFTARWSRPGATVTFSYAP